MEILVTSKHERRGQASSGRQQETRQHVFVPGLGSNYPLQNLVGFLSELKSSVDLRFLVECHDVTSISTALITK